MVTQGVEKVMNCPIQDKLWFQTSDKETDPKKNIKDVVA